MKIALLTIMFTLAASAGMSAYASETPDYEQIVRNYIAAKNAVQQSDSTAQDVEHMLSFMKDDIQTEHKPHKFMECENNGKGKERFRAGLTHYLGKYDSTDTEILNITPGQNMAAVKFRETIRYTRDGEQHEDVSESLYVLEFDGELIQREFRYDL